jgi:transposase InsO family protein
LCVKPILAAKYWLICRPSGEEGHGYENAPMQSFWGVLKNEQIHHCRYETRQAAIMDITEYIEIFYNRQGRQARLGFLSPAAFERWYYEKNWQRKIFGVHY